MSSNQGMIYLEIIEQIAAEFEHRANPQMAEKMAQYMRNLFPFYGIQKPDRVIALRPLMKELVKVSTMENIEVIAQTLWNKPQREFQYICIEYLEKVLKHWQVGSIRFFENLIVTKSWWDSVDFIASHLVGKYFLQYGWELPDIIDEWNSSDNFWLNRTAIIFQLSYKEKTDIEILTKVIETHIESKEFFIQKAIGWALRQYAYTNPEFVVSFVQNHKLAPLSKREALKNL